MKKLAFLLLLTVYCLPLSAQTKDYAKWVNPFIGTGGHGHTFPGATMPFGMVQLSPDTRIDNWDGSSGYHYSDDTIYGFSHTHLSGTGIPDGCDILFMPGSFSGGLYTLQSTEKKIGNFSHENEKAEPGYYSVKLDGSNILAELTATNRVGVHRYTFPNPKNSWMILDLGWRDKLIESKYEIVGNSRIEGYRRSSSWAKNQTVYFVAEFSKPIKRGLLPIENSLERTEVKNLERGKTVSGTGNVPLFEFDTSGNSQLILKVAISYVSIEGARKNLAAELPGWDFDKVRADAKAAWNKELSKIEVSGGTDAQTTTFYTALYHTMIQPNVFSDVDGSYRGLDGKTHNIGRGEGETQGRRDSVADKSRRPVVAPSPRPSEQYTVFSLWDTFRAAHPLYTIIDERRTVDFINTFIRQYEQGGRLPVWELWGEETDTMIGYHAVSVIADAMAKGIKGFDYEKAYKAAKHSAELDHFGLAAYKKRGYISMEDENESVSKTLEYAYNDWCLSVMATAMKEFYGPFEGSDDLWPRDEKRFAESENEFRRYDARSRNFENLFDSKTGFFRPKKNGGFVEPFAPNEVMFGFTEGNSWQYSFFVPHNVTRLMELMGGREKFAAKLDELFTTKQRLAGRDQPDITGLIGQYAHGNEPSHHIPYLYSYAGQPWKTQQYVRKIMDEFYKNSPDGLIGNEDCGQMSAWYVLSASGFYPVAPGSSEYVFGSPLFKEVRFNLENGKKFIIKAPKVSDKNIYIKSVKHDKFIRWNKAYFTHRDLIAEKDMMKFAEFEFEMTDVPVKDAFRQFPGTKGDDRFVAVPVIEGDRTFAGKTTVTVRNTNTKATIHYTTDSSSPTPESKKFSEALEITADTTVKAFAYISDGIQSPIVEALFRKRPNAWTVKIEHKYNRQYTGGGDDGLIDGIRGTLNFASGEWQGYQPQDFVATVDLQRETVIKRVGGGFLQNARSWIWMPTRIVVETSLDGVNFIRVADIKTDVAPDDMKEQMRDYVKAISLVKARYVRIHAYNLGKIPAWHPGVGDDAFIFVDEIIIE